MARTKDLTGNRYGSLLALAPTDLTDITGSILWDFQCDCGKPYRASGTAVKQVAKKATNPQVPSCGCVKREVARVLAKETKTKHGFNRKGGTHPLYSVYMAMYARCYNPNVVSYACYGAEGVTICPEWLGHPEVFVKWALAQGWKRGLHIDKDIKGGNAKVYSPATCILVTQKENNTFANSRATAKSGHKGIKLTQEEVSEIEAEYATGTVSQYSLAKKYDVTRSAIQRLVNLAKISTGKRKYL